MNIYFSGVGGVGIGPLAEIAIDAGYNVIGSDLEVTLMTKELSKKGVEIHIGPQDGTFLQSCHTKKPIDWFIYTAALRDDHPELLLAKQLGIKVSKRDGFLNHIFTEKNLKLIAIAGTHGKTTTTGMFVWTMQQLGIPVSYLIGSTLSFGPGGKYDPKSEYFILECDEYNRNFLNYKPYLSLITSVDHDHFDTYPTEKEYLDAFTQFITKSNHSIGWSDQHKELYNNLTNAWILNPDESNTSLKITGERNRRNATLVQKGLQWLKIDKNTDLILANFPGTDRRFEKLADNLYSDYAHHPAEIEAALQLASEVSDHIVLVYQPHQNVRQHEIRDKYTDQFEKAEKIYWLPTYEPAAREKDDLEFLQPVDLIQNITNKQDIVIVDFNDELWQIIQDARNSGKLVLGMGAGRIDGWLREKLEESK